MPLDGLVALAHQQWWLIFQIKPYRILGAEILSYEEIHGKTTQISKENKLYPAK